MDRHFLKIFLVLSLQLFGWVCAYSQAQGNDLILQSEYFDESDGLVGRDLRAIVEVESGLVWIATNEGLNYFDGYDFNFIEIDYQIIDLILDQKGNIWILPKRIIGSDKYDQIDGTFWLHPNKIKIINPSSKELMSLEYYLGPEVKKWKKFSLSKSNDFFVLQTKKEVYLFSNSLTKTQLNPIEDGQNYAILPTSLSSKYYYQISNNKISYCDNTGNKLWTKVYFNTENPGIFKYFEVDESGLMTQEFYFSQNRLFEVDRIDQNGEIENIDKVNLTVNDIIFFQSNFNPYAKFSLNNGVVLTRAYGILNIAYENQKDLQILKEQDIDRYGVVICMKDKYDNIWLGTHEGVYISKFLKNPFQIALGVDVGYFSCRAMIKDDNDRLIVNTYAGVAFLDNDHTLLSLDKKYKRGIDLYKIDDNKFISGSHIYGYKIVESIAHPEPHLKISDYVNESNFRAEQILLELSKNKLLSSCFGQFNILDLEKNEFKKTEWQEPNEFFESNYYYHAEKHPEGIWLCGFNGLSLINEKAGKFYISERHFEGQEIRYFYKDEEDIFWIATSKSGLIKWTRNQNKIETFAIDQGFSNHTAHVIYPDDFGNLWIPTNNGLNKINKETGSIKSFFKRDGLPNSEFNHTSHYKDEEGFFYFGTIAGLVSFHPKDFNTTNENQYPLKIDLTRIQKLNDRGKYENYSKVYQKENKINIYPKNTLYALSFSLGNHFTANNNYFESRLFGLEDEWKSSKDHEYKIGGLPVGNYEFQIRGRGTSSQLTENTIKIPITVHAHIYQKAWFIILLLCVFAFALWLFFRWRINNLSKEKIKLQHLVAKRTNEIELQKNELFEINKTKDRLFAIIAHDLRSPSLTLRGLTKKFNYLIQNERYEELVNLGNYIEENLSGFEKLINNLLNWAVMQQKGLPIRKESIQVQELIDEILSIYKVMLETRNMTVELDINADSFIYMDRNMASTILRNLIDNAIKYSNDGGVIKISNYREQNFEVIKVKDNGQGMSEEEMNSIRANNTAAKFTKNSANLGLQLSIQMTKLAKGQLGVQSVLGKGSIFIVKLPNQVPVSSKI